MKRKRLPLRYRMIRGAIGKRFVIKHYSYGVVMTRYPDMKNIIPSESQKMSRRLFRKAVKYAQSIYADSVCKELNRRLLRRPKRLFQALMKEWFNKRKEIRFYNDRRLRIWKSNVKSQNISLALPLHYPHEQSVQYDSRSKELLLE